MNQTDCKTELCSFCSFDYLTANLYVDQATQLKEMTVLSTVPRVNR